MLTNNDSYNNNNNNNNMIKYIIIYKYLDKKGGYDEYHWDTNSIFITPVATPL
jgi:hypothetical protein